MELEAYFLFNPAHPNIPCQNSPHCGVSGHQSAKEWDYASRVKLNLIFFLLWPILSSALFGPLKEAVSLSQSILVTCTQLSVTSKFHTL